MTKQIDIKELIPYLKQGWVAMDENKSWIWFKKKPRLVDGSDIWLTSVQGGGFNSLDAFSIKPAEDWTKSLIKVENKDE